MEMKEEHLSAAIRQRRAELAGAMVDRHCDRAPDLEKRHGREKLIKDAAYHLDCLAEAVWAGSPALFLDYIAWTKVIHATRSIPPDDLEMNLESLQAVLREQLPHASLKTAVNYVDQALQRLAELPVAVPAAIQNVNPFANEATAYLNALLAADRRRARQIILDLVESGMAIRDVYMHVFGTAQHEVGRLWQMNRVSVAQEHFCTAATQQIMTELYPRIFAADRNGLVLVMACVSQELHEIGARMVADFFEMDGWDTFYLGANTPTAGIVETALARDADVLAVSATMTFHIPAVREVVDAVRSEPLAADIKILVGGYPFDVDQELWRRMGADGGARSAEGAVALARELVD